MKVNKAPKKPYRLDRILKEDAQYNIIFGKRSNGKSYAIKEYVLKKAFEYGEQFGYIRRWGEDIKGDMIESYFADMPIKKITKGKYDSIIVYQKGIYFAYHDEEDSEHRARGERIGYAFRVSGETHYKSMAFPNMTTLIFEEFNTDQGYIANEPKKLMSIVSTVFRMGEGKVFLIGNTVSRINPYFSEWCLTNTLKQKIGQIDVYTFDTKENDVKVKIACEYCGDDADDSKMFFGNSSKMITGGAWETEEYPHIEGKMSDYEKHCSVLLEHTQFTFSINLLTNENNEPFLYVYPNPLHPEKYTRVLTDRFDTRRLVSYNLNNITKYDNIILLLYKQNKVVFSDNLTATEFYQTIKERGGL